MSGTSRDSRHAVRSFGGMVADHPRGRPDAAWETASGKLACEWAGSTGDVRGMQVSADGRRAATDADGTTALVWSLAPPEGEGPRLTPDVLWERLGGADAGQAYRAVWLLAGRLDEAADDLRKRLPPERGPDLNLPRLLTDLDSTEFDKREGRHPRG